MMRRFLGVLTRCVLALLLPATAGAGGNESWNPTTASYGGVPLPGSGGYYQYAPSVVQLSADRRIIYYCSNQNSYQTYDHIAFNIGTRQADGSYQWSATAFALDPQSASTPWWASYHLCDPEVVRGAFRYAGHTYAWAMFFTATWDAAGPNVIGVAYADAPEGPWVIASKPLIDQSEPDYANNPWGVGQPSVTSIDGAGRVLLFYSGVGWSIARRELDLGNADAPLMGPRVFLPTSGLTLEPEGGMYFHNASFVYDSSRDEFFVSRDTGYANDRVEEKVEVARIDGASIWTGSGTWRVAAQLSQCQTGYQYNHNSGLVRNAYGGLSDASSVEVYFATEPSGGGFYSYRMWRVAAPLSFVSGHRPEVAVAGDGRLSVFGHSQDRCSASAWGTTQASTTSEFGQWTPFGASPAGRPVAAKLVDGRLALFARAADGTLWWNQQSSVGGAFPGWTPLESGTSRLASASDPAVARMADGRFVVAIRRNDSPGSRAYLNYQQSPGGPFQSSWQDLGASPLGSPVFGTNSDGTLVLFARAAPSAGGQIWFNPQMSASGTWWGGWRTVEGSGPAMAFEEGPTVARQAEGRLVLAARRNEGSLSVVYVNTQTSASAASFSSSWTSLGASPAGEPVLVEQTQGRLALLARAADGALWWRHQDTQNGWFYGWDFLGGASSSAPVAGLRADGRLDIVVRHPDGRILHSVQSSPGSLTFSAWTAIR